MRSFLEVENGVYDNTRRFAFTNITDEPFTSAWDGQPISVQAHQTIELKHHMAVKMTLELVDKIMIGNAKLDEVTKNQPYYRSPQGSALGVPAARKVWEDQILRELRVDEESPEIQILRAEIREELKKDLQGEASAGPAPSLADHQTEFVDISQPPQPKTSKKPLKVKVLKA